MLTGSCFCSELTFVIRAPLLGAQSCHCSRCRKVFSGTGSAFAFLAEDSFERTCEPTALGRYASSDGWEIGFCGRCGSTLCGIHDGKVKGVTLGTIDGDPGIQIQHLFVGSKAPWGPYRRRRAAVRRGTGELAAARRGTPHPRTRPPHSSEPCGRTTRRRAVLSTTTTPNHPAAC
jgi:hypothetical protein